MSSKASKERFKRMRAAEAELDTIYFLLFSPLNGEPEEYTTAILSSPWVVELMGNPDGKPELIEKAIKIFETRHNVNSWEEISIPPAMKNFYLP